MPRREENASPDLCRSDYPNQSDLHSGGVPDAPGLAKAHQPEERIVVTFGDWCDIYVAMAIRTNPRAPVEAFFGLLGVAATVSGLMFLPPFPGRLLVYSALAAAGVGAFGMAGWRLLTRKRAFFIRSDLSAPEFDISWALGQRIYAHTLRKAYPTREQADKWLSRYSKGVFQAYDDRQRLWGYFSLWPLTPDAFKRLKNGEFGEEDLDETMIASKAEAPFIYWYVADILKDRGSFDARIKSNVFSEYLRALMIREGLQYLQARNQFAPVFEMIALAVSGPGKRLLKDFHFQRVLPAPGSAPAHPIFVKTFTAPGLRQLLSDLGQTIERCEPDIKRAVA